MVCCSTSKVQPANQSATALLASQGNRGTTDGYHASHQAHAGIRVAAAKSSQIYASPSAHNPLLQQKPSAHTPLPQQEVSAHGPLPQQHSPKVIATSSRVPVSAIS